MDKNKGSYVWRLIGILLLIGLVIGGGIMAYRAGVAQGIAQAPEVAAAISSAAESGEGLPMPAYGYGRGYPAFGMRPHHGFFPFAGILGFFLFILLFFGLLRLIFFRPWAWHHGHMHPRGPWGTPPWAQEENEGQAGPDAKKSGK
jgi:hypothetical protein